MMILVAVLSSSSTLPSLTWKGLFYHIERLYQIRKHMIESLLDIVIAVPNLFEVHKSINIVLLLDEGRNL
jgi:hypothetical protein